MKKRVLVCLLIACVILAGRIQAQSSSNLLKRVVEAHGGTAALSRIGDAAASGELLRVGADGRIESCSIAMKTRGFSKVRSDVSCARRSTTYVSDGEYSWLVENGAKRPLTLRNSSNRPLELNPAIGVLGAIQVGAVDLQLAETQPEAGTIVLDAILRGPQNGGPERAPQREYQLFIDAETHLIRGLRYWPTGRDGRALAPEDYVYSDYRQASGIWVPFQVDRYSNEALDWSVRWGSFQQAAHGAVFREP